MKTFFVVNPKSGYDCVVAVGGDGTSSVTAIRVTMPSRSWSQSTVSVALARAPAFWDRRCG